MERLRDYVGQELVWTASSSAKRTFELRAGERTLATLAQPSIWRENRVGMSDEGSWTFTRVGVFRPRVVIASADAGQEVASLERSGWRGEGTLMLPDGRRLAWQNSGAWGATRAWCDEAGQPVMRFHQSGAFKVSCGVTIDSPEAEPHTMLLAMLGWYLMLLKRSDDTATTAAVTVAVTS